MHLLLDVYCCTDGISTLHSAKEANRKDTPDIEDTLDFFAATVECNSHNELT